VGILDRGVGRSLAAAAARPIGGPGILAVLAEFDLHRFQPQTFLEAGNIVVVLLDVDLTVKNKGGRHVKNPDALD
jgi:hypothetical protein